MRRITGDNNANQRIDIGDAVLISRLQVKLEEVRSWDIALNDLNSSGAIDNGDVVKALRAVVGLDPQPTPGSEGKRRATSLNLADALGMAKVLVNTNDVMALELIDGPVATMGQSYRVAVRLNRVKGSLSGLSFTVKYPASLSLTDKQVGALVPGDALPFWNEGAGQVSLAAIRSTAWANATGVAAVLTFVPSAAFSGQAEWPLRLEQAEITGSGFDVRSSSSNLEGRRNAGPGNPSPAGHHRSRRNHQRPQRLDRIPTHHRPRQRHPRQSHPPSRPQRPNQVLAGAYPVRISRGGDSDPTVVQVVGVQTLQFVP